VSETRTNGCLQTKEEINLKTFAECSTVMSVCVLSVVNVLNMHKHRSSPSGSTSSQWKHKENTQSKPKKQETNSVYDAFSTQAQQITNL